MAPNEKAYYINGFYDGGIYGEVVVMKNLAKNKFSDYLPPKVAMKNIIGAVDQFYRDDANLSIKIPDALHVIKMQLSGVDLETIDAYLNELRAK